MKLGFFARLAASFGIFLTLSLSRVASANDSCAETTQAAASKISEFNIERFYYEVGDYWHLFLQHSSGAMVAEIQFKRMNDDREITIFGYSTDPAYASLDLTNELFSVLRKLYPNAIIAAER